MAQKTAEDPKRMVPLTQATILYRLTRPQMMRKLALGEIQGELRGRNWFIVPPDESKASA